MHGWLVAPPVKFDVRPTASVATMPTRTANVGLYRKLLRAAQTFESYNTRDYAVRYVRDDFRAAAMLSGKEVRLCALFLHRAHSPFQ